MAERSGLGLDAQRRKVAEFVAERGDLIGEYVETQSGKRDDREELTKAIETAMESNAALVVASPNYSRRGSQSDGERRLNG